MAPRSEESRLTERWLQEVIERDPAELGDWRQGKVCQVCGAIATVGRWQEWVAGHAEGGEFVGVRDRHASCQDVPPGGFAERPYRFCEVCQKKVRHEADRRIGLSWICASCERRIRKSGHDLGTVLAELARLRFHHFEQSPARRRRPKIDDSIRIGKRVAPPAGWLPPGLYPCETCGEVRGATLWVSYDGAIVPAKSTCICEGIVCKQCGERTRHRPITNLYRLQDGYFWHYPYFAGWGGCPECGG